MKFREGVENEGGGDGEGVWNFSREKEALIWVKVVKNMLNCFKVGVR